MVSQPSQLHEHFVQKLRQKVLEGRHLTLTSGFYKNAPMHMCLQTPPHTHTQNCHKYIYACKQKKRINLGFFCFPGQQSNISNFPSDFITFCANNSVSGYRLVLQLCSLCLILRFKLKQFFIPPPVLLLKGTFHLAAFRSQNLPCCYTCIQVSLLFNSNPSTQSHTLRPFLDTWVILRISSLMAS